jgi:hypothetical protein
LKPQKKRSQKKRLGYTYKLGKIIFSDFLQKPVGAYLKFIERMTQSDEFQALKEKGIVRFEVFAPSKKQHPLSHCSPFPSLLGQFETVGARVRFRYSHPFLAGFLSLETA